jgi:hypothetical protein
MLDRAFYQYSGIHVCPLSRSMLYDQSYAACPCPCCMSMSILHVHVHVNAACPWQSPCTYIYKYRTVQHPVSLVSDWKKLTMPEQVRYRTKLTQSGIFLVRYWIKIRDAGMLMPALVSLMSRPSYEYHHQLKWCYRVFSTIKMGLPITKIEFPSHNFTNRCRKLDAPFNRRQRFCSTIR